MKYSYYIVYSDGEDIKFTFVDSEKKIETKETILALRAEIARSIEKEEKDIVIISYRKLKEPKNNEKS